MQASHGGRGWADGKGYLMIMTLNQASITVKGKSLAMMQKILNLGC
jgi:hypothetical protein